MIAKILGSSSNFPAMDYNSNKIELSKGELLETKNFPFSEFDNYVAKDLKDYLKKTSRMKLSDGFKNLQFHATISCKGIEYDKMELKDIAIKWMDQMGYGKQPYAIIYHSDSNNNHVHLVSTRVNISNGKKIENSNERYRSLTSINSIMKQDYGVDIKFKTENKINNIMNMYSFDSFKSLKTYLNSEGKRVFVDKLNNGLLNVYDTNWKGKFNLSELEMSLDLSAADIKKYQALLYKNLDKTNSQLYGYTSSDNKTFYKYESDLSNDLKNKFGIDIRPIVGKGKVNNYLLIDHQNKRVLNGNSILNSRVLFKEGIISLDPLLIASVNRLNLNSHEKLEAASRLFGVPFFALYKSADRSASILNSYREHLNKFPDTSIIAFAQMSGGKVHTWDNRKYLVNFDNGFFENVKELRIPNHNPIDDSLGNETSLHPIKKESNLIDLALNIISSLNTGDNDHHNHPIKKKGKRKKN